MTPAIERIRYYDGEYLRAFDFAAEQGYHNDMRRRLNMALHLYGIVEGLQLIPSPDAGISQVSISPGMAIDPFGREIFLLAPYTFDDQADVLANRIRNPDLYEVWIKYDRVAETPPSAGYGACNSNGETTRWRETYKVVLLKNSQPVAIPAVTDDISEEDPDTDTSLGVFLGMVYVTPGSLKGVFSLPNVQPQVQQPPLEYIGLRAQRIQPPDFPDTVSPPFDITSAANSIAPPLGVDVESNLFVDENLIVGDNFAVTLPTGVTTQAAGNGKVAADLFLQGELYIYRLVNNPPKLAWLGLGAYIKSFLPDVKTGTQTIAIPNGTTTDPSQGTYTPLIPVTTSLTQFDPSKVVVFASISAVAFNQGLAAAEYQGATYAITASASPASTTSVNLSLGWTVGPIENKAGNLFAPIFSITVTWLVVFYPL